MPRTDLTGTAALRNRNSGTIHLPDADQGAMPSNVAAYTLCKPNSLNYDVYWVAAEDWGGASCKHCLRKGEATQ